MDWTFFRIATAVIASIACFTSAAFVLFRNPHKPTNRYYAFSNVTLGLWNVSDIIIVSIKDHHLALFLDRLSCVWGILVVPAFFYLCISVAEAQVIRKSISIFLWSLAACLSVIAFTPLMIANVVLEPRFAEQPGPIYPVFIVYFVAWLGYGLYSVRHAFSGASGIQRNQLRYLLVALALAFVSGLLYFANVLFPSVPPIFYVIEMVYLAVVAYAVIRYRAMDINLVFRYATIYFVFALSLSIPLSFLALIFPNRLMSIILVFVALFLAPIIEKKLIVFFREFVDRLPPFRGRYQVLSNIPGFQRIISTSASVKHWATNVVDSVNRLIEVSNAVMFIYDERHQIYMATASVGADYGRMLYSAPRTNDPLILHLREVRKLLQRDYVDLEVPPHRRSEILTALGLISADICAPFFNGDDLIGFLSIGKKLRKGRSVFYEDNIHLKEMQKLLDLPTKLSQNSAQVHRVLVKAIGLKEEGDAFKLNPAEVAAGLNAVAKQSHLLDIVPDPQGLGLRSEALTLLSRYHRGGEKKGTGLSEEEVRKMNVAVLARVYASELMNMDEEDLFHDEDLKAIWGLVQGAEGALMVILVTLAGQMKTAEWAHDLRHPFTKGSFKMIDAILAGQLGDISKETAMALVAVREDAAFVERQIKTLVDPNIGSTINKNPTSANRLLVAVMERYGYMAKISEINLRADIPVSDSEIFCDPDVILYRVFNNLLDNALRCTPRGGGVVIGYVPNDRFVKYFVSNVGGDPIPESAIPHLFERGAWATRLDNSGLAGLGLFNVEKAVKDHGGEIRVSSSKVEGTTFEFTLPLVSHLSGRSA